MELACLRISRLQSTFLCVLRAELYRVLNVCVGCTCPFQVFDLHYADGSHLRGFNGVDQVWVSFCEAGQEG